MNKVQPTHSTSRIDFRNALTLSFLFQSEMLLCFFIVKNLRTSFLFSKFYVAFLTLAVGEILVVLFQFFNGFNSSNAATLLNLTYQWGYSGETFDFYDVVQNPFHLRTV